MFAPLSVTEPPVVLSRPTPLPARITATLPDCMSKLAEPVDVPLPVTEPPVRCRILIVSLFEPIANTPVPETVTSFELSIWFEASSCAVPVPLIDTLLATALPDVLFNSSRPPLTVVVPP